MHKLFYRPFGSDRWLGPLTIDEATPRDARERAKHFVRSGAFEDLKVGRLVDWRYLRSGVCVDAWSMVVERE